MLDFVLNSGIICMLQEAGIYGLCSTWYSTPLACTLRGACPGMQIWVHEHGGAPISCPASHVVGAGNDRPVSCLQGCPGQARGENDPKHHSRSSAQHPWVRSGVGSHAPYRPLTPPLQPAGRASRQDCGFWLSGI